MERFGKKWKHLIIESTLDFGIKINEKHTELFAIHAEELLKWNRKMNLTAITDPVEIAVKHFIDSLIASLYIPDRDISILDIGAGGGFPGIPIKTISPKTSLVSIEASLKKVNFLKHVIRTLFLENCGVFHGRAEDLSGEFCFSAMFDVVICRAFSSLEKFIDIALGFVKKDGRIIALKGGASHEKSIAAISAKYKRLSFDTVRYILPVVKAERNIVRICQNQ